jgi:hypothetical protein
MKTAISKISIISGNEIAPTKRVFGRLLINKVANAAPNANATDRS